jgi:hypothetical protein
LPLAAERGALRIGASCGPRSTSRELLRDFAAARPQQQKIVSRAKPLVLEQRAARAPWR